MKAKPNLALPSFPENLAKSSSVLPNTAGEILRLYFCNLKEINSQSYDASQ